jgi:hypothetical protein
MPTNSVHNFAGPMEGNFQTCQAQAYFITFGSGGGGSLYMCLSWYFVCKITFKLNSNTIQKLEPIMFLYAIFVAVFFPSYFLSKDLMGPDLHYAYCIITDYNDGECNDDSCWLDHWNIYRDALDFIAIWISINFALVFLAMTILLCTIFKYSKDVRAAVAKREQNDNSSLEESHRDDENEANEEIITALRYSRATMSQAIMYIMAYFLTWIFFLLSYNSMSYYKDVGVAVLFPLQGFWNMSIFIYDKAYLVRHSGSNESMTWWKAIHFVLYSPSEIPEFVLTNVDMVHEVLQEHVPQEQESEAVDEIDSKLLSVYDEIAALKEKERSESMDEYSIDTSFANRSGIVSFDDPVPLRPSVSEP